MKLTPKGKRGLTAALNAQADEDRYSMCHMREAVGHEVEYFLNRDMVEEVPEALAKMSKAINRYLKVIRKALED